MFENSKSAAPPLLHISTMIKQAHSYYSNLCKPLTS